MAAAGKSSGGEAEEKKKKKGVVRRARVIYGKALCGCGGSSSGVVNPVQNSRKYKVVVGASKEMNMGPGGEDLRDLMQILSMGKGGGAKVDVDSEGNIVWRKAAAAESSYGGGVGRIGRIDEEKMCCFREGDVFKKLTYSYSRTTSLTNTNAINCITKLACTN